jgi:hypothetical protein
MQSFSLTPLLLVDCLSAMIFRDRSAALMDECLYRSILPVTIIFLVADEDATLATLLLAQIVEICDSTLLH